MPDYQDRILALLGIAATKEALHQPCPSENIMSAFIEDRVDSETRAMMLSHLNRCELCYLTWEQLSFPEGQNNLHVTQQHKAKKVELRKYSMDESNSDCSWQKIMTGLVFALLLIALVTMLANSYKTMTTDSSMASAATLDAGTLTTSINQFPIPWKNQPYALHGLTYALPVKAFGVGTWNARNALLNEKEPLPAHLVSQPTIDWHASQWRDYYTLGHLTLDAWVLANAEQVKSTQWTLLRQSIESLEIGLQKRQQSEPEAGIALQMIDKMKASLEHLSKNADYSAQKALLHDIEIGLQKFF